MRSGAELGRVREFHTLKQRSKLVTTNSGPWMIMCVRNSSGVRRRQPCPLSWSQVPVVVVLAMPFGSRSPPVRN